MLPSAMLVAALTALILYLQYNHRRELVELEESHVLDEQQVIMARICESVIADLLVLTEQGELAEMLDGDPSEVIEELTREFVGFISHKRIYDQVRFIDADGRELVRVDDNAGRPAAVPADQLQDKSARYYFRDAIRLEPGEVFLSPLDLNVERGRIEMPPKPMLRVATPVADARGVKRGIVILNYLADDLLSPLRRISPVTDSRVVLLNMDGYLLHGPVAAEEFGFMYPDGRERTFAVQHEAAWPRIRDEETGFLETAGGFYAFTTIRPLESPRLAARVAASDTEGHLVARTHEYRWKLVAHLPQDEFRASLAAGVRQVLWPMLSLFAVLTFVAWLLARAVESRLAAERDLQALNVELEQRVVQRTAEARQALEAKNAAEAELARTERLRALGSLASGIAHDFNNILAPIFGFTDLARTEVPPGSTTAQHLDQVETAAGRARELVRQILTFGSQRTPEPQPVDLAALIEEVAAQTSAAITDSIKVRVEAPPPGPMVAADPGRLHQMLTNLLRNAVQALDTTGGNIEIVLREDADRGRAVILVSDDGPGIDEEIRENIFEPYFTTKAERRGTGLGLATVRSIVDQHAGSIAVASRPGRGTIFEIHLPLAP
jgi:signal transduction histidine kinase